MKKILALGLCLGMAWSAAPVLAQAPAVPAAPAAPALPAAAAPAATAQPTTLWSFLGISHENCEKCREKCCKTPIGQLLNNMTKPLSLATGGLVGPLCPPYPSAADLAKLADPNSNASPAEAAAAAIKADEAGAAARRAAIRYLGTVDCHYYPEAEKGLIAGLRADRNECVRFEAALALSKGCCCSKNVVEALMIVVSGDDKDGNPSETSERVKTVALHALHLCLPRLTETERGAPVEPPKQPEVPPKPELVPPEVPPPAVAKGASGKQTSIQLAAHIAQGAARPLPQLRQQPATLSVLAGRALAETAAARGGPGRAPHSQGGLLQLLQPGQAAGKTDTSYEEALLGQSLHPRPPAPTPPATQQAALAPPAGIAVIQPVDGKIPAWAMAPLSPAPLPPLDVKDIPAWAVAPPPAPAVQRVDYRAPAASEIVQLPLYLPMSTVSTPAAAKADPLLLVPQAAPQLPQSRTAASPLQHLGATRQPLRFSGGAGALIQPVGQ